MEANQKILYENFIKEAEIHKNPVIRERCKKAAADILKSFPQFAKKEKVKEEKTNSKDVNKEKK